MNGELNERLTSLKSDSDSLTAQLSDANAALARVMITNTLPAVIAAVFINNIHLAVSLLGQSIFIIFFCLNSLFVRKLQFAKMATVHVALSIK